MNRQQIGLLALIRSALTNTPARLPKDFTLESVYPYISNHHISSLAYHGAYRSGIDVGSAEMQKLFVDVCHLLTINENQKFELKRIYASFDEAGIDYMPIKGAVIKDLYPMQDMRYMSDADILIRTEQYGKIRPILIGLGFEEKLESDHELVWTHPLLYLELHKCLIPSYNPVYYAYFGDGWDLAKKSKDNPYRYEMSDEDTFVFLFTHFAKHYRDGGIGIKHITDLWLFLQKKDINEAYVEDKFKQLQLLEFYRNIRKVLNVWFDDKKSTDLTDYITNYIFKSGAYGTFEGHALSQGLRKAKIAGSAKNLQRNSLKNAVFLPLSHMRERYPILRRLPFLIPIMWCVRWFTAIFFRRQNILKQSKNIQLLSENQIEKFEQALHYVGLDFNFNIVEKSLTLNQIALLQSLSTAIHGHPPERSLSAEQFSSIDWKELMAESSKQSVPTVAFEGMTDYCDELPPDVYDQWFQLATKSIINGTRVIAAQRNLVEIMEQNNLDYFILKGAASASYYPKPDARSFGDVDFLINPAQRETVEQKLIENGYKRWNQENDCHVVFCKKGEHLEMHFEISGIPYGAPGEKIRAFMVDAVKHYRESSLENHTFRIPTPLYHGLILLLHMQHHMLAEGLGLRHLCDWACFVKETYTEDFWEDTLLPLLEEIGLLVYAKVMTKTCAVFLHTPCPDWAKDVEKALCYNVIQDILAGGNFGRKNSRRSQSAVLVSQHGKNGTAHGSIYNLVQTMNKVVKSNYPILKKAPYLYPFLYAFRSFRFLLNQITGKREPILQLLPDAKERKALYDKLHVFETK